MPRDANLSRERLLRAAEVLFARDGVQGTRLADIARDAGERDEAVIGRHFGSRDGMLNAIIEQHMDIMEAARARQANELASADVRRLVSLIVEPTASLLHTARGRDFLRVVEQIASFTGAPTGRSRLAVKGSLLAAELSRLEDRLATDLGADLARERVGALVMFMAASLADRARAAEGLRRQRISHGRYVRDLCAMLSGAMQAPAAD